MGPDQDLLAVSLTPNVHSSGSLGCFLDYDPSGEHVVGIEFGHVSWGPLIGL
jgi:hypothetical protein